MLEHRFYRIMTSFYIFSKHVQHGNQIKIQVSKPRYLYIPEAATGGVLLKRYSEKFRKIHRKTPASESIFLKKLCQGRHSGTVDFL